MIQVDFHIPNIIFVKSDGRLSQEGYTLLRQLVDRTGGTDDYIASTITSLSEAVEAIESLADDMETIGVSQRAQIQKLIKRLNDLESEVETWPVN